jgi:membrane-associated phospholipid phosphatase
MTRNRVLIFSAVFIAAFTLAFVFVDGPVSAWVGRSPLFDRRFESPWKWPKRAGEFQYIIPVILAVAVFHKRKWRGAVMLLVASGFAGAAYSVLKWTVGRSRPNLGHGPHEFDFFKGGLRGFTDSGNLAFPSGHATFAFAVAAGLAILLPRWRWALYVIATLCGVQRILEHAHHPSDVIASAFLGVLSAYAANHLCQQLFAPSPEPSAELRSHGFPVVPIPNQEPPPPRADA